VKGGKRRGGIVERVISKDGTPIAFDRVGSGPAVILVDGGMCYRGFGPMPALAKRLAPEFTVYHYDRRGRGDSGNADQYAVDREIEDLQAVLQAAGGSAHVFGASSGGALALEATRHLPGITSVAIYEAPFIVDDTHPPLPRGFIEETRALVADGRRGAAVKKFMRLVGVPAIGVLVMTLLPLWKKMKAIAHTLANDLTIVAPYQQGRPLPDGRWSSATMPSLVMAGGKSPAYMQNGMRALAAALPNARHLTLAGQTHMIKDAVLAPELARFFGLAPAPAGAKE
jgi:pimeloyl-ACP methyl ester carboxylesterase